MKEVTKTIRLFISDDGRQFTSAYQCEEWENRINIDKKVTAYLNLPLFTFYHEKLFVGVYDETGYDIIYVRNEEDVKVINDMLDLFGNNEYDIWCRLSNDAIGKNICISFVCDRCSDNALKIEGTFEDFRKKINDAFDSIETELQIISIGNELRKY